MILGNVWMFKKKKSHLAFLYVDEEFVRTCSFFYVVIEAVIGRVFSFFFGFVFPYLPKNFVSLPAIKTERRKDEKSVAHNS